MGHIVEFGGVDAGDGGGGDVADIVCAGAAGGHAESLNAGEDADDVLGLKLSDLEVAAGGEITTTGAQVPGHLGETAHLVGGELAAGDAHTQHEGVLRGGDVEEAVEFEAEEIVGRWLLVFAGVCEEFVPDVEGVFFELPAFFLAEIGDGCTEVDLVGDFVGVAGECRSGLVCGCGSGRESDSMCDPSEEALEVLLLL